MQARLAFSKRCELAKRKNANEESRLRSTLERCEKEYERTMKSMFVERHDVRSSIRDLRKVKRISLDTKPLVESDNFDGRIARLGDGSALSPRLGARHTNLPRTMAMTQRTCSMPDLHESAVNLKPKNLPLIPDQKSPTQQNTKNDNRSPSQARKRCQTFPEGSARETPTKCDDLGNLGTCSPQTSRGIHDFSTLPRTPRATRHRASLASIHGNDGKFLRRFRTLTLPEQGASLVRGTDWVDVDFDRKETDSRDAVISPRPNSSLIRRPRSCSVRTISAPGALENQMPYAEGRPRSFTLTDGYRPRSKTLPVETAYGQSGTISRPGEHSQQGLAGDQVKLLEVDRGDLTNSPRFRRRLSPSAGIARLRQEGDAALATRALVSSYRRDQGMVKTEEELKLTREEARKRIEKWKETKSLDEEKGDQRKSAARRTFMSVIRFILAVNAFKSLRNRKAANESGSSEEET